MRSGFGNTIQVPYKIEHNGIVEWEWDNYSFDPKGLIIDGVHIDDLSFF